MSYIYPNSVVYILRGVSLDSNYNHTLYQTDPDEQRRMFIRYQKFMLTNQSYQRAGLGKIRVSIEADNLYNCNYMMFQNSAFGSKWFYAFLDKVTYINNNTSEIEYSIDYMQTWYFDYELGECFVEREHSSTDVAGDNIVPENLEIGELITRNTNNLEFPYMLGGIVLKKALPYTIGTGNAKYHTTETFTPEDASVVGKDCPSGVPTGFYIYAGIPLSLKDIDNYWNSNKTYYTIQDYEPIPPAQNILPLTLPRFISLIVNDRIDEANPGSWSIEDIVDVYIYPAELNLTANITRAKNAGYRDGVAFGNITNMSRPYGFVDTTNVADPYYPKNNKLYTFPFVQLELSNNMGKTSTYRYEDFINPENPRFGWFGNYNSGSALICAPISYRGVDRNFDNGLTLTNFPVPGFEGQQFYSWLETNRNSVTMSMISSAIGSITAIAGGVASENPALIAGGVISLFSSIARTVGKIEDIKNTPPQVQGQIICDAINTGLNRTGFRFYHMMIKKEFAIMIDNFFTMFGYATKRVKVPNVRDTNAKKRIRWNYVKTAGCIIHGAPGKGLPAEDEKKISQIYDNGITFWKNLSEVGNYSLDNSIEP